MKTKNTNRRKRCSSVPFKEILLIRFINKNPQKIFFYFILNTNLQEQTVIANSSLLDLVLLYEKRLTRWI
jgi:hypothetical protein